MCINLYSPHNYIRKYSYSLLFFIYNVYICLVFLNLYFYD
nr:MAG TPA: hypothetical protein [Caudoviricetes sp.]